MNASLFHMSNIMSDVKLHGTESLLERIFVLQQQLEAMNRKYDSLQLLHTTVVKQKYELETKVYFLQNENECIGERMNEREQFYNSRCRQLESQYDRLQLRYRDLRDNYYKEKNDHGEYGFDLTGDVKAEVRKLSGQASHREVSPYKVKGDA